ncbi:MAG: histidine kinase, partial [Bacteroidetes bacterium]|nr:histidine kinase [Bacteroidota bacterium]
MKALYKYIIYGFLLFISSAVISQENRFEEESKSFIVRGIVVESDTYKPIPKVNIEVNGGAYTTTDIQGDFRIKVKKGDELVIRHSDFETVYYIIKSNENIKVEVRPNQPSIYVSKYKRGDDSFFKSLLDSIGLYLKKDAEKSIQFVEEALEMSNSVKQNAIVYEILADVYMEWKQYDLAITNYRISLQNIVSNDAKLKLAKAYEHHKNYQESITAYSEINKQELSNWQLTILYEGLGDVYYNTQDYVASIAAYNEGLQVAQEHLITPKITDFNSKLAQAYSASGKLEEAEDYYGISLNLSSNENRKRAIEEKDKVATFQNNRRAYNDEIELRIEALQDIEDIEKDSIFDNESALTPQKQNYKIGSAYFLQKDYDKAIPFLKKSIKEADRKEDLIVQKDATRKLSEVYRDEGNYNQALVTYQAYVDLVDKVYSKKEQEISQAARFRRDIIAKQSRITGLESDRALSESKYQLTTERNKRQRLIIYSLIGGLLLLLIAGYFMFKNIKQQKLNNNLLALKSLRSQMNPHFIFNALNSVNSFIANNDERTANKYLSDFSLLMRAVLENSKEDFISLEKEIALLKLYTKLEHFRFKDKFDYVITVDENVTIEEFQIPPMLLQPYIENAVWHGLRYKKERGQLSITISQVIKDEITITITDDGIGREKSKNLKT